VEYWPGKVQAFLIDAWTALDTFGEVMEVIREERMIWRIWRFMEDTERKYPKSGPTRWQEDLLKT